MVLFAMGALIIGYLLNLPVLMLVTAVAIAALFGLYAPDSEVNDRINKRRDALRREMAFMLDRVAYALMAYGTLQEALVRLGTAFTDPDETPDHDVLLPTPLGEVTEQRHRMASMGTTLTGMGGGLFAEFLNQMASLLLSSTEERFGKIRETLARQYASSPEVQSFLDIVESGLHGSPMKEQLFELADAMIGDLAQEQREAGMKATAIVVAAAGLILIPLLLVVGGPAFTLAISVFAP
jgi:Flp pilus assembly protein TadB